MKILIILDPEPSTPQQRSNFTATELFNNQDLYSSRRYSTTASQSAVSSTADKSYAVAEKSYSTASTLAKSTSSSIVSSSLARSSTSSIVNREISIHLKKTYFRMLFINLNYSGQFMLMIKKQTIIRILINNKLKPSNNIENLMSLKVIINNINLQSIKFSSKYMFNASNRV